MRAVQTDPFVIHENITTRICQKQLLAVNFLMLSVRWSKSIDIPHLQNRLVDIGGSTFDHCLRNL